MALKRVLDSIDEVPEQLRELYVQEESTGKFRLDAEPDAGDELKRTVAHLKKEKIQLTSALDEFRQKYGDFDPDEFKRLKTEADKRAEEEAQKAGDWTKRQQQLEEKYTREIQTREKEIQDLNSAISRTLVDSTAAQAIAAAKGVPELLMPHVTSRLRAVKSEGRYDVRVIDENGQEMVSPRSDNNGPMTVSELIEEMRSNAVFARAFDGTSGSGGGASQNGNGGAGAGRVSKKSDIRTWDDRKAYIEKFGQEAYLNLPQ